MEIADATRMILAVSAARPELLRLTRRVQDEVGGGRDVPHGWLSGMLREAARKDVFPTLRARHGAGVVDDMVTTLAREIDRRAPVVRG